MFVVYPLLCLSAALCVREIVLWDHHFNSVSRRPSRRPGFSTSSTLDRLLQLFVLVCAVVSASRTVGLAQHFGAPMRTYAHFSNELQPAATPKALGVGSTTPVSMRLCVGKEWYRFPSSFFLPDWVARNVTDEITNRWTESIGFVELSFLKSGFTGQLPQAFDRSEGTRAYQPHFNDLNLEETSRYVSACARSLSGPHSSFLNSCRYP